MLRRHVLLACIFAVAASGVLARATSGDKPLADWLRTDCSLLNARQQQRVAALFAADAHQVFTRGGLAALAEEDVAEILSPLPTLSRRVVATAAASLRKSHAGECDLRDFFFCFDFDKGEKVGWGSNSQLV
ncbi:hypothetical protein T484DRAFT_1768446 [Baffinella frigidus]|nr:hypothetical protein T484DRAFT_1768446 [Cryptophyta sp. CCMP2293]